MKRMLWVILMMSVGATFTSPLFPLYQEHYQLSSLQITILFAVYALFLLPSLLIVGSRGSRWGLKRVLRISIWISIAATILFMGSQQAWLVYAARILEGIAYGTFTGTAVAFLLQQSPKGQAKKAITLSGITVSVGFGLGPALTGLVIQYVHVMPLRVPFWFLTLLLVSAWAALETLKDHDFEAQKSRDETAPAPISLGVPADIRRHFWSFSALPIFTLFTLNGIILSLIPSFVKSVIHTTNLSVSGLLILLLLGGGALMQLLPWVKYPVTRLRIGIVLLAIGAWLVVFSGSTGSIILLWIGVLVQAIGSGWTFQISLQLAGELPNPEERPKVITSFYLAGYSGFIVPIVGTGILTYFFDLHVSLIVLNILASLLVLYMLAYSVRFARYYSARKSQLLSQEQTISAAPKIGCEGALQEQF
ncbi:MFS transporter [Paenibacillus sp. J23TS9]|uniref:MFS transporter n=1 Tax=Paenibacillus sp. J23TS9 TaxID=2807193 RepID=UPI001B03BECA|nr:MFS transporter [Paenibacillus sp. J23TS9]GIP28853.1 MFS transporter [Paenibacillus sp. J23TS9]